MLFKKKKKKEFRKPFIPHSQKWVLQLSLSVLSSPFSFSPIVKNCFRVSSRGRSKFNPYILQANDSFCKQQWITCLRQAIVQSRDRTAQTSQSQLSLHPESGLCHIAELSLSSDTDMADHTSRWLLGGLPGLTKDILGLAGKAAVIWTFFIKDIWYEHTLLLLFLLFLVATHLMWNVKKEKIVLLIFFQFLVKCMFTLDVNCNNFPNNIWLRKTVVIFGLYYRYC